MTAFLEARDDIRDLPAPALPGFSAGVLIIGRGPMGLEVIAYPAAGCPTSAQLRDLHHRRQASRAAPVLVAVTYGHHLVALATRFGDEWSIHTDLDLAQGERIAIAALDAPDRHAADAFLRANLAQLDQPVPGVRNAGLFAMHELEQGVPARADWRKACELGQPMLDRRGRALVTGLGYTIEQTAGPAAILRAAGTRTAIAVFLDRPDEIEPANAQYDGLSPVSYALAKADAEHLDYVVVAAGAVLRIYPVKPGTGTARRGRTETFVEINLALLDDTRAGYLTLLASADALGENGSFVNILDASRRFAADLGARLRDRVYEDVMPRLAGALASARRFRNPSREQLHETLEMTLLTLFRLLFVAYAEDKELLPYHTSEAYREHSLKRMAQRLADEAARGIDYGDEDFYWTEVNQLWKAVEKGNAGWRVPVYNGGLFSSESSPVAIALAKVKLADRQFAPALRALLLDETHEAVLGPVDFRALGVREFGTIYEGLLEQELSVAEQDLAVDARGAYVPVQPTPRRAAGAGTRRRAAPAATDVVVAAGEVYLHDKSGARKASGAYYTKDFAVEHLLDRALEPALAEHLVRLDTIYDDREAADRFFDFHVADIAMGSGHFLVAAVDHLERGLSGYLAKRRLPGVRDELERLRTKAREQLGDDWRGEPIEDTQLLRRQIARRCVHGVDLNPLAVELARLSLWIHTFVPGLPLSFLDMNLIVGNSLVGIATLAEAEELLNADDLFGASAEELLGRAREPLAKLGRLAEATAAEVKEARKLYEKVRDRVAGTNDLFTVLAASRLDDEIAARVNEGNVTSHFESADRFRDRLVRKAETRLQGLRPLHFPIAFPQVFLRERAGFDVILGNPPWEKVKLEEHAFWARHEPGLRGLNRRDMGQRMAALRREREDLIAMYESELAEVSALRNVLASGSYPGMGTGDPDLYKAFCWRFWALVSENGGRMGVVLPRSAFAAKGSMEFRQQIFGRAQRAELTMLLNNMQWVFEEVHPQYTIALAAITRGVATNGGAEIILDGPYSSRDAFDVGVRNVAERPQFRGSSVREWNDTASLPLLPSPASTDVFLKLRQAPRLDLDDGRSWRARPYVELHATNDSNLMDLESKRRPRGFWPVFKGESFDLWTPDTGTYYGWADPREVVPVLQRQRELAAGRGGSPFTEFTAGWATDRRTLPCQHTRIAFRDVSRATDTRTVRAALVPPHVVIAHTAPYLLWPRGDRRDEAFVLGALSSLPLDWYARRFVETHLTYFVFNPLPIPRPPQGSALRDRVIALSSRLAVADDDRFEEWGAAVGVTPSPLAEDEKDDLIHQLDAAVAHLYGVSGRDVAHIFETFHVGWDYQARLDATLRHFRALSGTT
ncbi:MAG: Eco57I restriction-modification methylase domain-containing protein [Gemmatimonadaceae bacterium]